MFDAPNRTTSQSGERQDNYTAKLLDALYSGSMEQLCSTAAVLCGNPLIFASFNSKVIASFCEGTGEDTIREMIGAGVLDSQLIKQLHDRKNLARIASGEIMNHPVSGVRFLCVPVTQSGIHMASILLFEEHGSITDHDRQILKHVAKCFRLLQPDLNMSGPTRLIYEYALVRALSDEHDAGELQADRFSALGYDFHKHLYAMVISRCQPASVNDLRQHLAILAGQVRQIIGDNGICTTFRDHVVVLLNLFHREMLDDVLESLKRLCMKNDLKAGISPHFDQIEQLKTQYRYALDAIGIGSIIHPEDMICHFSDLRIYKFITTCARSFALTDLIPEYLERLIYYDRENNSNLLETLYHYVYSVRNTKKAAELMHIHRNTLLYRLEKINQIMGVDPEDGDAFLQLMLSFKFLEYSAKQEGRELCFKTIRDTYPRARSDE